MVEQTATDTPAPELPQLVKVVRGLLKELRTIHIPDGKIKARIEDELTIDKQTHQRVDSGLMALFKALALYIEQVPGNNEALLARLRHEDGCDLASTLNDIAIGPDDLAVKKQELRNALTLNGKPLMAEIERAVGNTSPDASSGGGLLRRQKGRKPPSSGSSSGVDDEAIRRSAEQYNLDHGGANDQYFHHEAETYNHDHNIGDDRTISREADQYDKDHGIDNDAIGRSADRGLNMNSDEGYEAGRPKAQEIKAYRDLARKLAEKFELALGSQIKLGPGNLPPH